MNVSWKTMLEQIMGTTIVTQSTARQTWMEEIKDSEQMSAGPLQGGQRVMLRGGRVRFVLRADDKRVEYIEFGAGELSGKEALLIEWALRQSLPGRQEESRSVSSNQERMNTALGEWLQTQLDAGRMQAVVPDEYNYGGRLYQQMVPFLLISEQETKGSSYGELEKLLRSFFEEEMVLIPLKGHEWLVLGPSALLLEETPDGRGGSVEETEEDMLVGICSGLHDMLASEWIGECHVAVGYPFTPAETLVEAAASLRETIMLGRKFHVGETIHLPWLIQLERLLNAIPEAQRVRYMEQVLSRSDALLESEIVTTLETYFSMNCNVSDTAKKLFIHRNTLLYRLDKLKQDTGLDVRLFRDAVLVKIILLLYKVTKRK